MPKTNILDAPQAKGIVIELVAVEAKGHSNGTRKCAKVKLIKNQKEVLAYIPFDGGLDLIEEGDEVVLENKRRADIPGVKCQIIKVAGVSLNALVNDKRLRG